MRLIDADEILPMMERTMDMQDLYLPIHFQEMVIDEMPTVDAVPVVRCGECKWARDYKGEMLCGRVPLAIWTTMPERYCVDGERKTE